MRLFVLIFSILFATAAQANVSVVVDSKSQTMTATIDGTVHTWPVSTGKSYGSTPPGTFGVQSLSEHHRSSLYNWAPMPNAIFFNGNIAIHGTDEIGRLGSQASHGCVRLNRAHAKLLYKAVERSGRRASIRVL